MIDVIILVIDDDVGQIGKRVDDQSLVSVVERYDRSQSIQLVHLPRPLVVEAAAAARRRRIPGRRRCRHGAVVGRRGGASSRRTDRDRVVPVAGREGTRRRPTGAAAASRLFVCVVAAVTTAPCNNIATAMILVDNKRKIIRTDMYCIKHSCRAGLTTVPVVA